MSYQTVDETGFTNNYQASPRRIISVLPSLTECVWVLGHGKQLVGIDRYSTWPSNLSTLPKVGGGLDPNIELIVSLKPDLVLMSKSSRTAVQLRALGLRVVQLDATTYQDAHHVMKEVGKNLGDSPEKVEELWRGIEQKVADAATRFPSQMKLHTYYFEVNSGPYAAGEASFIGELLKKIGLKNIIPLSMGPFPKINPEFIVLANPDLILMSANSAEDLKSRPGWKNIQAIKKSMVYELNSEDMDQLVRPGPRLGDAALYLSQLLSKPPSK